jgi:acetylglutamate kinase
MAARRTALRPKPRARRETTVLKIGGELIDDGARTSAMARLIARVSKTTRVVVVHGGGKEIDRALALAAIPKHQVDGLRITDEATLDVVIAVLAGTINTRLVAAVNAAGGRAVGLTGADASVGQVEPAPLHRATNGELVNLGFVGQPVASAPAPLVDALCDHGFVPVIACLGASRAGALYNVNADTLAGNLAARLRAARLIVAGSTAGVLNGEGRTIAVLDQPSVDGLVSSGTATAGMIAKLRACADAMDRGVADVVIADGRTPARLAGLVTGQRQGRGPWTRFADARH